MSRKILVISDDKADKILLSDLLEGEYNLSSPDDWTNVLRILRDKAAGFSAILVDLAMSEIDGFEVLKRIQSNAIWSQIPVIVCTSIYDIETKNKALTLGAYAVLERPYDSTTLRSTLRNCIRLRETASILNNIRRDKLTGLYNREAFFAEAERMISFHQPGYYVIVSLNIDSFKVINDQYSTEKGDQVLKHVADCLNKYASMIDGISCRLMADNFAMMFPSKYMNSEIIANSNTEVAAPKCIEHTLKIRIGRYLISDPSMSVSAMYDRAAMAQESIKGRYDVYIAEYDESMRNSLLNEQQIVTVMHDALNSGQFVPWFQPQYNHATGALIGAEALVRWKKDGIDTFISPNDFIPIFERNGFVYEIDKYMWEQVCILIRKWLDNGYTPVPISVNISRYDIFREDFLSYLKNLVDKYRIPIDFLRLEITESAFSKSPEQIVASVKELVKFGFTIEIDDFGSGYSSLNTLKDVPADILKLDMRFMSDNGNSERGGTILESIVRMAKWLGMSIIAEGVETKNQADYLKSIGCYYIQGYFYSRPVPLETYEALLAKSEKENQLSGFEKLETFDNSAFWNRNSMDTLIFNSYVGGASIFEYNNGKTEELRVNDRFKHEFDGMFIDGVKVSDLGPDKVLDEENLKIMKDNIEKAIKTRKESTCEVSAGGLDGGKNKKLYLRCTVRVLAQAGTRYLIYCVLINITSMRVAEQNERFISERIRAIMDNTECGITAVLLHEGMKVEYLFVNDKYYEILGFTKQQYEKEISDCFSLIHKDDYDEVIKRTEALKNVGQTDKYKFRIKRRDGREIWLRIASSVIILDDVSAPVQLSCYTDITSEVELEYKERETAAKLKTIMDNVGNGITTVVMDGEKSDFLFANDKYFELIGYSREECNEIADIYSIIHPKDREKTIEKIKQANSSKSPTVIEYRVKHKDGRIVWLKTVITIAKLLGIDKPIQLAVFSDITAEKDTEEQLKFLNDTANELLVQHDAQKAICDIMRKMMTYFDGNRAYVFELDYANGVCNNTYEICADGVEPLKDKLQNLPISDANYWLKAFEKHNYVSIKDISSLDDEFNEELEIVKSQGVKSLIAAPLIREQTIIGFVGINEPRHKHSHIDRLSALGKYIAAMLLRRNLTAKLDIESKSITGILDEIPGGFSSFRILKDYSLISLYHSVGFLKNLGWSNDEYLEKYDNNAFECVHPSDIAIVKECIKTALESGEVQNVKYRLRKSNEKYVIVTAIGKIVKSDDDEIRLNVYYSDFSEE